MGNDGFPGEGRLAALGRALLFLVTAFVLLLTGLFLVPEVAAADLPAGDGLPLLFIAQFALVLLAAFGAAWILQRLIERRAGVDLGFPLTRRAAREAAGGIAAGLLAVAAVIAVLSLAGVYRWTGEAGSAAGWAGTVVVSLAAFAIPAAAEEAVFRGYLLESLAAAAGPAAAVAITSVLFALVHGGNPGVGPWSFANLLFAGVLLAVAVLRTGTLWLATGVHLGWNWAMAGPLDLPVSGIDPYDAPFYDAIPAAPAWISGGAFGPEGGLAGTLAACVALGLILRLTRPGAPLAPPLPIEREA